MKSRSRARNLPPRDSRGHRDSGHRDKRGENKIDGRRVVIGLHASREVLKVRPYSVQEVWLKEGAERNHDLSPFIDFARKNRIPLHIKKEAQLDRVASSHQGVCLYVNETPQLSLESLGTAESGNQEQGCRHDQDHSQKKIILLALDEVSDPHNVGAALRTAWLLGAKGILVTKMRSAHLTPAATKVASGGAEHVPLIVVDNLVSELRTLKDNGFWIYGLAAEAQSNLWGTRFHERVVLVVGSEDKGLRSTTANVCDELVSIPQVDHAASFNASVAAALALYEVARQHKNP